MSFNFTINSKLYRFYRKRDFFNFVNHSLLSSKSILLIFSASKLEIFEIINVPFLLNTIEAAQQFD